MKFYVLNENDRIEEVCPREYAISLSGELTMTFEDAGNAYCSKHRWDFSREQLKEKTLSRWREDLRIQENICRKFAKRIKDLEAS